MARAVTAALFILLASLAPESTLATTETFSLDNGLEVVLKENHGSPMVASIIFVRSGAKYESRYENGLTHFLEHLLFDGTVNQTRQELDASLGNLGGYINAFTRKDLTAYFVLLPRQYTKYGMTVQADMLFNSTFPETELAKERKIVIEEINQGADRPGAPADAFFVQKAYAGTEYDRPVLGYASFIENIPRAAVVACWKKYYTPDNMTMLVIGDFEPETMKKTIVDVFGAVSGIADSDSTQAPASHQQLLAGAKRDRTEIVGQTIFDTLADVTSTYVNFSFAAPRHNDPDYLPFCLLAEYLALEDISPLKRALMSGDKPLVTEVGVSLETKSEFSRLEVSAIANDAGYADDIVRTIVDEMSLISSHVADSEAVLGIKTSVKCEDIYIAERLHHYGIIIAPMMMTVGWDFIQQYPDLLEEIQWSQCQMAAGKWLDSPRYIATTVRPVGESGKIPYVPAGITSEEVVNYFDTASFPEYELAATADLTFPATDSVSFELVDPAHYHREVLDNGLTVIIKSSPDSRVFAINVIGKNRSANEPEDKAGITDFVNRCLEKGTLSRDASQLTRDLSAIGARVTLYDNPWIPFDDRYTTRRFSFIRFETIDEFAPKGFRLFVDMLCNPAFDSAEVAKVCAGMLGTVGRDATSPMKVSRDLFYRTLFENRPFERPIMGTPRTISSITVGDLRTHHANFYSPENMIISIATNRELEEVLGWVKADLGQLAAIGFVSRAGEPADPIPTTKQAHVDLEKEQIGIYLGSSLPGADSDDAAALTVAISILSNRLALNLREKQGLAYSTGAGIRFEREFGWYYCMIGTASANYQRALDGMILQTDKLRLDGPTSKEIRRAKNRLWGRLMTAKLSRINQAYYLGVDEFFGRDLGYDRRFLEELEKVTMEAVRRVASRYFRTDTYVIATAGKLL